MDNDTAEVRFKERRILTMESLNKLNKWMWDVSRSNVCVSIFSYTIQCTVIYMLCQELFILFSVSWQFTRTHTLTNAQFRSAISNSIKTENWVYYLFHSRCANNNSWFCVRVCWIKNCNAKITFIEFNFSFRGFWVFVVFLHQWLLFETSLFFLSVIDCWNKKREKDARIMSTFSISMSLSHIHHNSFAHRPTTKTHRRRWREKNTSPICTKSDSNWIAKGTIGMNHVSKFLCVKLNYKLFSLSFFFSLTLNVHFFLCCQMFAAFTSLYLCAWMFDYKRE